MNPIEAVYNQYLQDANRGRLPNGISAKGSCSTCHGRGLVTKVNGHDGNGKPIRHQEACECVRRRITSAYHAEMRGLQRSPTSSTKRHAGPRLPKKDDLQRVDRLDVQVQSRKRKLQAAEEELQRVEQGVSNAVSLLNAEIEDMLEEMRLRAESVERIEDFQQHTLELIALLNQENDRLTQARRSALEENEKRALQVQKNQAAVTREKARVAKNRGRLVQVVACRVRELKRTQQKLNKVRRVLGLEEMP